MWFCCDFCMEPIEEGLLRFDCTKCDNFTLCMKCYKKNTTHLHRFKKQKVPPGQGPPQNSKELIAKAYMVCCECGKSLLELSRRVFVCNTCCEEEDIQNGDAYYWCKDCKETTDHEHKLNKLKNQPMNQTKADEEKEEKSRNYLDNLFEDYHK